MKTPTAGCLVLMALVTTSCGGRQAVEIDPRTQNLQNRWSGILASPPEMAGVVGIRGSGWMGPRENDSGRSQAEVQITNAVPGGEHPWHVHRGRCGSDQGIFGDPGSYEPLKVGNDGRASSSAELNVPAPRTGEFFINVHASEQNMGTAVACGNLAPPVR